jgi:hypothetical protein
MESLRFAQRVAIIQEIQPPDSREKRQRLLRDDRRLGAKLRRHLDLNDIVLDRVDHKIADRVEAQLPHNVAAMRFHGLRAQIQQRRNLFRALPFRQQLSNLAFSDGQRWKIRGLIA